VSPPFGARAADARSSAVLASLPLETELDPALARGFQLVAGVETLAAQLDLGEGVDLPDLPALAGGDADQAILRTVGPLYLASELEQARLLPVVEALAGLFASGAIDADLGPVSEQLAVFWRGRHERFTSGERRAFFARLFGADGPDLAVDGARNVEYEHLLIGLCDELCQLESDVRIRSAIGPSEARLRLAANLLVGNLLPRTGGIAAFAARDILTATTRALEILKSERVQRAVGAASVWQAVERLAARYLRERAPVTVHVNRARDGQTVLAWLADVAPELSSGARLIRGDEPAVAAACAWMEASLALAQDRAESGGAA
jgi:hypothetical protein